MRLRPWMALLALALLPWLVQAEDKKEEKPPPADPSAAEDVQDVIFFTERRPLLLRLHLTVDGKPFSARWEAYLRKLFAFLDRDGDGVLDKEEASRAPAPAQMLQLLQQGNLIVNPNSPVPPPPFADLDADGNGEVTPAEFLAYYRRNNVEPLRLAPSQGLGFSSDFLSEALFACLDTNKDGKLSKEELAAAESILLKFDENDDEMVSAQELLTGVGLPPNGMSQFNAPVGQALLLVTKEDAPRTISRRLRIAKEVLNRYDKDKNQKLSREEIGIDRELFDRLDTNKDGELDALELLRWIIVAPDVEVVLRLGRTSDKEPAADIVSPAERKPALAQSVRRTSPNIVSVVLGENQINVVRADAVNNVPAVNARTFYQQQFKAADRDNKGFVTKREIDKAPNDPRYFYLRGIFAVADRDDDGKLTEKELNAWIELQEEAAGCSTSVLLVESGRGLFALLDANKDGRLSLREMRTAWARLAEYDRDGDGCISRSELPRQYNLVVNQGMPNFNFGQPVGRPVAQPAARGPLWFRKMDRNGDGDVSEREFLGTREDFRKIDTDGDGLISVEEAEKADAWFRQRAK